MDPEYRIEYTIQRFDGTDFEEIGFGSSGSWSTPNECAHMVESDIANYEWEALRHHPDPEEVKREVEDHD